MPSRGGVSGAFVSPYQISIAHQQNAGAGWFGPLSPLPPSAPADVAGRQWDFPSGFNLNTAPRAIEPVTFDHLRGLADAYDLLRLVIETRKDQVARMSWSVKPRQEAPPKAGDPALLAVQSFLRRPDGAHAFADWLRILLEDLFVIDAPALYMQRDRAGRLLALLPLDGATIKPLVDDWGRTPEPYFEDGAWIFPAAYQQILKGLPAVDYSKRDLIYRPRNCRANHAYGFSPVEQILTTVNIALRRQIFTLEYYTSGNIPDSLIGVPDVWTPDQIASYQKYWDSYIEGDLGRRRKAKFVPGGVARTFIQTKEPQLKDQFDEWLARVCCFAFSISPQALIAPMNRASAETQKETADQEGLWPVLNWVKALIDDVIEAEFNAPHLEFVWGQDRAVDPAQQATILTTYVKTGVITINEARAQMGLAPLPDAIADTAMTLTPTGYQPIARAQSTGLVGKYDPSQPRRPAGAQGGGQWTRGDEGGATPFPNAGHARDSPRALAFDDALFRPGGLSQPTDISSTSTAARASRPFVDLRTQKQYGGHGWPDHVARTDDELIAELKRRTFRNLFLTVGPPAYGSFSSIETANTLVMDTLEKGFNLVRAVASGKVYRAWVNARFGFPTGREAYREDPEASITIRRTYEVGVLIEHSRLAPNGWYIVTAYPRNDRPESHWSFK